MNAFASFSALLLLSSMLVISQAHAQARFSVRLQPSQEVPVVSSQAKGEFELRFDFVNQTLSYTLSFSGLEGDVTQAHIHIGQKSVNGGISIWLCSNLASPPTPVGTQPCPASGTVTGTIGPAEVVGPTAQGIEPGELEEVLRALARGDAYANVHSTKFPGGEIRGQLDRGNGHRHGFNFD